MPYEYQEFPKWKYHYSKPAVIVSNKASEDALGPEWYNSPADVKPPEPPKPVEIPKPRKPFIKEDFNG